MNPNGPFPDSHGRRIRNQGLPASFRSAHYRFAEICSFSFSLPVLKWRGMKLLRISLLFALAQAASVPPAPATGSVEGIVVRLGTTTPIAGADVELSRVEGTASTPLPPGAAEVFATALTGTGNNRALVPAAIASEVRYLKTGEDGYSGFHPADITWPHVWKISLGGRPSSIPSLQGGSFPTTMRAHRSCRDGFSRPENWKTLRPGSSTTAASSIRTAQALLNFNLVKLSR